MSTASLRHSRWLNPPPARTAAFSIARSPGSVLRVSRTLARPAVASTYWCVAVATPDACCRRLSAVRSAPRIERRLPDTDGEALAGLDGLAVGRRASRRSPSGSTWVNTSVAAATPASTP